MLQNRKIAGLKLSALRNVLKGSLYFNINVKLTITKLITRMRSDLLRKHQLLRVEGNMHGPYCKL